MRVPVTRGAFHYGGAYFANSCYEPVQHMFTSLLMVKTDLRKTVCTFPLYWIPCALPVSAPIH